jgi:hemin uptake protein HemP
MISRTFIEIQSQHERQAPSRRAAEGGTMTRDDDHPEADRKPDDRAEPRPRVIDAGELFQGGREVWLELMGVRYRLRITRRNKLILQK